VRTELGREASDLLGATALVAIGLDGVVPGAELAQEAVGLLLRLHLIELVLALLQRLLPLRHRLLGPGLDLVQEPH
jgi:hypothetical protein